MRFTPYGRADAFAWTSRKLANAAKRGDRIAKREQDRYPLLADQLVKPAQFDADAESARRDMQAATLDQQAGIRAAWLAWRGPTTATYFRYIVDLHTGVVEQRSSAHKAREGAIRAEVRRIINQQRFLELEAA